MLLNQKNATAVAEDVMFKEYLLYHKAIKEAADNLDFEEVRVQRQMYTFLLCIHFILADKTLKGEEIPFVKTMEVYRAMKFFKMNYGKTVVYNYMAKLERMGVIEKLVKKSKIGKPQAYVTTGLGDYLLNHVEAQYNKAIKEKIDFSSKSYFDL